VGKNEGKEEIFTSTSARDAMSRAQSSNLRFPLAAWCARSAQDRSSRHRRRQQQQKAEVEPEEICRLRDRDRPGDAKNKENLLSAFPKNSTGKGEEMEKSGAGRIRRRRKGVRAEGGRLGWEEEAAERNWRRRPRKQMARGRSGERFLGASKGREAGHVGRGASLSGLEISRGPGI